MISEGKKSFWKASGSHPKMVSMLTNSETQSSSCRRDSSPLQNWRPAMQKRHPGFAATHWGGQTPPLDLAANRKDQQGQVVTGKLGVVVQTLVVLIHVKHSLVLS